jgi:hypothetical protein
MARSFGIPSALSVAKWITFVRSVYVQMKNKIGWLAVLTVLAYEVVQIVPQRIFNHAVSFIASAVWGS